MDNFNQETPLYILATAGMRLVEKSKQVKKVLNYCRQDFKRLLKSDTRTYMRYQTVINLCRNFFKTMTIRPHSRHLASGTRNPNGGDPPDIRRISLTSRTGSVNFANHIIRENIAFIEIFTVVGYQTITNY